MKTPIPKITFKVFHENTKGSEKVLWITQAFTQPVIKVGSMSISHLCLNDDSVSRMHAYVQFECEN